MCDIYGGIGDLVFFFFFCKLGIFFKWKKFWIPILDFYIVKENIVWEIFYKLKTWSRYLSNNTICWIGLGLYLSDLVYIFLLKIMMKNKSKKEIINKLQWIWQIKMKLNYDDVFTFNCEIMYRIETCYQKIYIYIYIK